MKKILVVFLLLGVFPNAFAGSAVSVSSSTVNAPAAPTGFRGDRQDDQGARLQWDFKGNGVRYLLYAAIESDRPVFHRETDEPLHQTYIVWDAPQGVGKKFIFYLTAVDEKGHESPPTPWVHVDLARHD